MIFLEEKEKPLKESNSRYIFPRHSSTSVNVTESTSEICIVTFTLEEAAWCKTLPVFQLPLKKVFHQCKFHFCLTTKLHLYRTWTVSHGSFSSTLIAGKCTTFMWNNLCNFIIANPSCGFLCKFSLKESSQKENKSQNHTDWRCTDCRFHSQWQQCIVLTASMQTYRYDIMAKGYFNWLRQVADDFIPNSYFSDIIENPGVLYRLLQDKHKRAFL